MTIAAGTTLYHGTSSADYRENIDDLEGPAWVSSSRSVAERFARRGHCDGSARVVVFELRETLDLPELYNRRDLQDLADQYDLDLSGTSEMRESVRVSALPGWIAPHNYPDGDDILLVDTSALRYLRTEPCEDLIQEPRKTSRRP